MLPLEHTLSAPTLYVCNTFPYVSIIILLTTICQLFNLVGATGFEPAYTRIQGGTITRLSLHSVNLVGNVGFEPTTLCSQSRCATRLRQLPLFVVEEVGFEPTKTSLSERLLRPLAYTSFLIYVGGWI